MQGPTDKRKMQQPLDWIQYIEQKTLILKFLHWPVRHKFSCSLTCSEKDHVRSFSEQPRSMSDQTQLLFPDPKIRIVSQSHASLGLS